jgi:hypothetical protein
MATPAMQSWEMEAMVMSSSHPLYCLLPILIEFNFNFNQARLTLPRRHRVPRLEPSPVAPSSGTLNLIEAKMQVRSCLSTSTYSFDDAAPIRLLVTKEGRTTASV